MSNYKRIIKECFWEYNFTEDDIKRLALSDDKKERVFLFQKILLNSTHLFHDLKIFHRDYLVEMIKNYRVPTFNHDYIFKRKNMAEAYFLDKPLVVDELRWIA